MNELEALGKTYTEVEKVMKILRSLPKKWETKVRAIQEAKDLTKLSLEELIGSLMTYEIELYNHQRVKENEKSIAFMASINDDEEEESKVKVMKTPWKKNAQMRMPTCALWLWKNIKMR